MGSGDLGSNHQSKMQIESMTSTGYQQRTKTGVDNRTPPSVKNIGKSSLLTKLSEVDSKENTGRLGNRKLKTNSNADLLPILPDTFTRNENKTQTEDTQEKRKKEEIKIVGDSQNLAQSISEETNQMATFNPTFAHDDDQEVDPSSIIQGYEQNTVDIDYQQVLKLDGLQLLAEEQDKNKRKSVQVFKQRINQPEDTVLTEQSKIGDPTSPNTVRSPYLKSSYNEISSTKKKQLESNTKILAMPIVKKSKTHFSKDRKSNDNTRKQSANAPVKDQIRLPRGGQEVPIQKTNIVQNNPPINSIAKIVIPVVKPTFGSS